VVPIGAEPGWVPKNFIGGKEGGGGEKGKEEEKKGREMSPVLGLAPPLVEWRRCWLAAAGR